MAKKVLKDSSIYILGEIFSKSIPFLLIPYMSRKLGADGYGELSYYQTYLALFTLIISLSQNGAIVHYFYRYGERSLNLIVRVGYLYATFVTTIIFIISFLFRSQILMYLTISVLFSTFVNVQLSVRQCKKEVISYVKIQFLLGLSGVIFTVLLFEIFSVNLVEKRILAILLGSIVTFLFSFWQYKRNINITRKFSLAQYKIGFIYLLSFGFPLIFHNGSFFIKGQLDRFFIYHQYTEEQLGIYAMGANLSAIISTLILAVNKAMIPYYFEALKNNKVNLIQIHKWALLSIILIPIAGILYFVPEQLFLWILGDSFKGVKYYFTLFTISSLLTIPYLLMVNYLFYHGKTKQIALSSVISTFCYLVFLIVLVNTEIKYIPFASIIGAFVILPVLYFITKKMK